MVVTSRRRPTCDCKNAIFQVTNPFLNQQPLCPESSAVTAGPHQGSFLSLIISHLSLYRDGRWGTTDDFTNSFLHFFSVLHCLLLLDLANSRPVHSLMLSSHRFLCLPCLLPPFTVLAIWFWPDLKNGKDDHTTAVRVCLRSSGSLRVVQLPAGS